MNTSYTKAAPAKATPGKDSKRRYYVLGAILLVLMCWYVWPDSRLAKVRKMQQDLFSASQLSPEERKQKFEALRAAQEKLPLAQRTLLRQEMGKQLQKKLNAKAVKYLAMAPAERRRLIDAQIAKDQKRANTKGGAGAPGGAGANGANGPNGIPRPGGPAGARAAATPEERDAKRREFLINATPMARAGMDQMRLDTATRRVQLGLPPSTSRGPGGR